MGFLDILGSGLGKMAAAGKEVLMYKSEYESMTDTELKREYQDLKNRSGTEYRHRLMAVKFVLQDRGYGQE